MNFKTQGVFGPKSDSNDLNDYIKKNEEDNQKLTSNNTLAYLNENTEENRKNTLLPKCDQTTNEIKLFQKPANNQSKSDFERNLSENQEKRAIFLLNIFKRAVKFSHEIKKRIFYKNYSNMTPNQKKILNDPVENVHRLRKKSSSKLFGFRISPLNPDKKAKKLWDFFFVVLTFVNFFILSLETCFFLESSNIIFSTNNTIYLIKIMNIVVYASDILLNFFTGYYYEGNIIMDLKLIRKNYFSNLFLMDFLSYVPIIIFAFDSYLIQITRAYLIINILFLFILKKYSLRIKDFKEFLIQQKEEYENHFSILVLYLKIFLIAHIFACFWYLIGTYNTSKTTWITNYNLKSTTWDDKYLNSIYWSLVTMVTVGYGDIVPQNNNEKVFCIITMLVGFTVFGFTLGNLGEIIHKMNAKNQDLYDTFKVVTRVMKRNNVDFDFQFRVRKYLEHYIKEDFESEKEEQILNKLSNTIKDEYLYQIYGKKISKIPFFEKNFSKKCIVSIAKTIKKMDLSPGETFAKFNDTETNNFYILFKGEVEMSKPNLNKSNVNGSKILYKNILKAENNYFNEIPFITNSPNKFDYKTITFCTLYVINRNQFIELLKNEFPEDYEKFCLIKDKIIFENNLENLYSTCISCNRKDHIFEECPFIHYTANRQQILRKYLFSTFNNGNNLFIRKNPKIFSHLNCLKYKDNLNKVRKKFKNDKKELFLHLKEFYSEAPQNEESIYEEDYENTSFDSQSNMPLAPKSQIFGSLNNIESENNNDKVEEMIKEVHFPFSNQSLSPRSNNSSRKRTKKASTILRDKLVKIESDEDNPPPCIESIIIKRGIFLKQKTDTSFSNALKDFNIYSFDFEEKKNYNFYYPQGNFENSLKKLTIFSKTQERKSRKKAVIGKKSINKLSTNK